MIDHEELRKLIEIALCADDAKSNAAYDKVEGECCGTILSLLDELRDAKHDRDVWQKLHGDRCAEIIELKEKLEEAQKEIAYRSKTLCDMHEELVAANKQLAFYKRRD